MVRQTPAAICRFSVFQPNFRMRFSSNSLFQEFGPRALGHRSLLAVPDATMRERMNRLKARQWYRPVAPMIAKDDLAKARRGRDKLIEKHSEREVFDRKNAVLWGGVAAPCFSRESREDITSSSVLLRSSGARWRRPT